MALDIKTAGLEFVKTVLVLYRSGKYYREKEVLAKKFLEYSIDAGHLITEVGNCPQAARINAARVAVRQLDRAVFVLNVMGAEGIYSKRRMQHVTNLADRIREMLTPTESEILEARQLASAKPQLKPQSQPERKPRLSLPQTKDEGGFNDVYEGKLKF